MNNGSAEIDELLLQMANYKNDLADMAAKKLFRKGSTSWEAYQYAQDRTHDSWPPDGARQQLRRIIKRMQVQIYQQREHGTHMNSRERSFLSCCLLFSLLNRSFYRIF